MSDRKTVGAPAAPMPAVASGSAFRGRTLSPAAAFVAFVAAVAALAGCAPDSVRNIEATGFNAWLDRLPKQCPNLRIGDNDVGDWLRTGGRTGDSDYVFWLDQSSRLFYGRITPEQYRTSVMGGLGGGRGDTRGVDCIVGSLPAERPTHPGGA